MTPTEELRQQLRDLLDEAIPQGGTDADTRFSDAHIDRLLTNYPNVYLAASEGWTIKAGRMQRELGHMAETQAGDERYQRVNLTTAVNYCLTMAKQFAEIGNSMASGGSRLLGIEPPAVRAGDPQ